MRVVSELIVDAFLGKRSASLSNSSTDGNGFYLWGNRIAYHKNDDIIISLCGYNSNTTRERLNGLLSKIDRGYIQSKKSQPYFVFNDVSVEIDPSKEYSIKELLAKSEAIRKQKLTPNTKNNVSLKQKIPGTEKSVFVKCWHCGNPKQKILSRESVFKCDVCKESLWTGEGGYEE